MGKSNKFMFLDPFLNEHLLHRVLEAEISHHVSADGAICYSPDDEEAMEKDVIGPIRNRVFPSWQVVTCPAEWTQTYRTYMEENGVEFREERSNGETWFLIPRKHRPHRWKLEKSAQGSHRSPTER
jgi:hypothetical protein